MAGRMHVRTHTHTHTLTHARTHVRMHRLWAVAAVLLYVLGCCHQHCAAGRSSCRPAQGRQHARQLVGRQACGCAK
eukprot:scaffold53757_cov18-Tisochrysis_lutea.AAC.1